MKNLLLMFVCLLAFTSGCGEMFDEEFVEEETETVTFEINRRSVQGHERAKSSCRGYDFIQPRVYNYRECFRDGRNELIAAEGHLEWAKTIWSPITSFRERRAASREIFEAERKKRLAWEGLSRGPHWQGGAW